MAAADVVVRPRILVLEDEFLTALDLCDTLDALGCEVVGPVSRVERALAIARTEALAGAVLDVNVDGERSDPVADALSNRAIPFVFVTGYAREDLAPRHRDCRMLQKPVLAAELKIVAELFDGDQRRRGT